MLGWHWYVFLQVDERPHGFDPALCREVVIGSGLTRGDAFRQARARLAA
jgi:hypothetical protein